MKQYSLILTSFIFASWLQASLASPCNGQSECLRSHQIGSRKIDYYSNYPLDQSNTNIEHVVFAIHGTTRNAWTRFKDVRSAIQAQNAESKVLLIAPYFKTNDDSPASNDYFWSSSGWKIGNTSNNGSKDISSFAVIDDITDTILSSKNFSNIVHIAVTGHSAGGQFTQRYALTTPMPNNYPQQFSFLVLNPSSYAYLNEYRPHPFFPNHFVLPTYRLGDYLGMEPVFAQTIGNCPSSYNDYKYGLNDRNSYSKYNEDYLLITQYLKRKVYYFLGSLDKEKDSDLDTTCSGKIQGEHRLARGINFFNFLKAFYPDYSNHKLFIVDDVGHDSTGMYQSPETQKALLNYSA